MTYLVVRVIECTFAVTGKLLRRVFRRFLKVEDTEIIWRVSYPIQFEGQVRKILSLSPLKVTVHVKICCNQDFCERFVV